MGTPHAKAVRDPTGIAAADAGDYVQVTDRDAESVFKWVSSSMSIIDSVAPPCGFRQVQGIAHEESMVEAIRLAAQLALGIKREGAA